MGLECLGKFHWQEVEFSCEGYNENGKEKRTNDWFRKWVKWFIPSLGFKLQTLTKASLHWSDADFWSSFKYEGKIGRKILLDTHFKMDYTNSNC